MSGSRFMLVVMALLALFAAIFLWRDRPELAPSGDGDQARGAPAYVVVTNPGATALDLGIHFAPIPGACDPRQGAWRESRSIEAGASIVVDAGPSGGAMPRDCAMSVTIQAAGGELAALAVSDWDDQAWPSALTAMPEASASRVVLLPAWSRPRVGSGLQIVARHLGTRAASLRLRLYDVQGQELEDCGEDCRRRLSPGETSLWRVDALAGVAPGSFGSALLESSEPMLVAAASREPLDARGLGPSLYAGEAADGGVDGQPSRLGFPHMPKQSLPAPVALRRTLGAGEAALAIQAGPDGSQRARLRAFAEDGQPVTELDLGALEPGRSRRLDVLDLVDLPTSAQAATVEGSGALAGLLSLRWPQAKAGASYTSPASSRELILPLAWRGEVARASWVHIQAPAARTDISIQLFAAAGGEKPIATWDGRSGAAESSLAIDLEDDRFADAGQGRVGWARISASAPISAVGFAATAATEIRVMAYPAIPASMLAEILQVPLFFSGRPDSPQQPTALPPATASPIPARRPTATLTARPPSAKGAAIERVYDSLALGPAASASSLAVGADGSIWIRYQRASAPDAIVRVAADGSARVYRGPADVLAAGIDELSRAGSMPGFWSIDPAGRIWLGARVVESGRLRELGLRESQPGGQLALADQVAIDAEGRAWVPRSASLDCQSPEACGVTSLLAFEPAGRGKRVVDLGALASRGRASLGGVLLLDDRSVRPGPISELRESPGRPARLAGPEAPAQSGESAWAVTADAFYTLPEPEAIPYPGLGAAPDPTALRNAGYATAAGRDGFGRPVVFTWLEIQKRAGDSVDAALWMNTWLPSSGDWLPPVELVGPGRPDAVIDPALDQVTSAAWCPNGELWLGTQRGIVARWDGGGFDLRLRPGVLEALPAAPVQALACTAENALLIATVDGLLRYAGGDLTPGVEIHLPTLIKGR